MHYDPQRDCIVISGRKPAGNPITIRSRGLLWGFAEEIEIREAQGWDYVVVVNRDEIDDLIAGLIEARRRLDERDPDATTLEVIEWHPGSNPPDSETEVLVGIGGVVEIGQWTGEEYLTPGAALAPSAVECWGDLPRCRREPGQ